MPRTLSVLILHTLPGYLHEYLCLGSSWHRDSLPCAGLVSSDVIAEAWIAPSFQFRHCVTGPVQHKGKRCRISPCSLVLGHTFRSPSRTNRGLLTRGVLDFENLHLMEAIFGPAWQVAPRASPSLGQINRFAPQLPSLLQLSLAVKIVGAQVLSALVQHGRACRHPLLRSIDST